MFGTPPKTPKTPNPPKTQTPARRWTPDDVTVTEPATVRRAINAAAIGNVTEWYDFGVYGYLALTIEGVFLPEDSGPAGKIIVAGLFAVSFLVRPLGGLVFGPLSDRIGRNRVLAMTMIMMATSTFLIGVIPPYAAIGMLAPFLLLACRLLQGFSTGGEYSNAMTFISEYAPDRRRGYFGSLLEVGTFGGYILGATVAVVLEAVLTDGQMQDWGWRLPFFVALPLGFVGIYLRTKLKDTPAFEQQEAAKNAPESQSHAARDFEADEAKKILSLWPSILVCCGLVVAWNVTNYMLTSFMPSYFDEVGNRQDGYEVGNLTANVLEIAVMAVCLVLIPVVGRLSDRVGRRPVVLAGCLSLIVLSVPSVLLIRVDNLACVFLGLLIMGLSLICFSSIMPSTLPSLFPTVVRAGALAIAFNVSISLFGGTTSTVMEALIAATGNLMWPGFYLMIAGVIGLVALRYLPESNGRPMWGSNPAAETEQDAVTHAAELNRRIDELERTANTAAQASVGAT
ncbi:MFS transporter [Corynebacterium sp.]|uniref:MFS transporter n=1 Tax=Corynebacterium sp. TaxID=1720 RepID=UPI0025BB2BA9|nr:MFS transporter [Corynebacterium sp.]